MIAAMLVIGAILELSGLALVARDVWDARRQRVDLSRRSQLVQVGQAVEHSRAFGVTAVQGGEPPPTPPLDERVATLERDLKAMRKRLDDEAERHVQAHRNLTDRFAGWIAEARREVFDLEQKLRPVIGEAAAGHIGRRAVGVGLFAVGLVVQTIANVLAL